MVTTHVSSWALGLLAVACAAGGCSSSPPSEEVVDAGGSTTPDTGAPAPKPSVDSGRDASRRTTRPAVDGGGTRTEAAPPAKGDARGPALPDSGGPSGNPDVGPPATPPDAANPPPPPTKDAASTPDAKGPGAIAPAAACTGTEADIYSYIPDLPPMTDALRGDIVACTNDGPLAVSDVQTQLGDQSDTGVTAVTGVSIYRVQFRTTRANGSAATSSARIYLPDVPVAAIPPLVVAAHGTEGLAAACATSMDSTSMRDLALPWAALGYPVIAPDYAGLGTPGIQGYTDNRDTARSVVDAVAALRKFVAGALSQQVVIDGHSQGGGAALATQALAIPYGLQGTLAAVLTFAPEYFSHLDSLGFMGAMRSAAASNPLTITTGVTKCEVAALMEYQYFANYVPSGPPTAGFPSTDAMKLESSIEQLCTVPLGGAIQADAVHVADWTDPTLRSELLACADGAAATDAGAGDGGASCTGPGQAFYAYLEQNIIPPDPTGAPILLVQGLKDDVMPPDQEAACNVDVLEAAGVTPQVCTDATASHTDVVQRNIAYGISWVQAILAGTTPPPCAADNLPACSAP